MKNSKNSNVENKQDEEPEKKFDLKKMILQGYDKFVLKIKNDNLDGLLKDIGSVTGVINAIITIYMIIVTQVIFDIKRIFTLYPAAGREILEYWIDAFEKAISQTKIRIVNDKSLMSEGRVLVEKYGTLIKEVEKIANNLDNL